MMNSLANSAWFSPTNLENYRQSMGVLCISNINLKSMCSISYGFVEFFRSRRSRLGCAFDFESLATSIAEIGKSDIWIVDGKLTHVITL